MKLNLKRPLAFFDLEATGTNIGVDRIVEISVIKLHPDDTEDVKTWRVHPGMPIPLESSLIHGIYDEHIAEEKQFKELAKEVADFIADSDLAGYNSNKFDIPMLAEEFLRSGVNFDLDNRHFVDVQNIFHQMEQRTLKAAYQFYCNKDIINAHSAEADTRATMEVLLAQLDRYADTEWEDKKGVKSKPVVNDVEALHKFTNLSRPVDFAGRMAYNENGEEVFNFGKHKGKRVEDVFTAEPSYYSWMMQGDFPLYTKRKLEEIYRRWNAQRIVDRPAKPEQPKPVAQPLTTKQEQPKQEQPKQEQPKPPVQQAQKPQQPQQNRPQNQRHQNRPQNQNQQYKKRDEEPAKPVDDDMLKLLAEKFKKG